MEKKVKMIKAHHYDTDLTIGNIYPVFSISEKTGIATIKDEFGNINYLYKEQYELVEEWQPKRGELVEVGYDGKEWIERTYLTTIEGAIYPYLVVAAHYEDEYINGEQFYCWSYKHIRQIKQQPKLDIKITVNGEEKTLEELNKIVNNCNE